jgi:dihydropteroate synthase
MTLRLGRQEFADDAALMMAIVNRTPDSFYDRGATWGHDRALERVERVVAEGAEIVDIGGVKAGLGPDVDVEEEKRRVVDFVAEVRSRHPRLVISVDTWRADVARAVCEAGADLLNDAWGGADPGLAEVAAQYDVAMVVTHTGGLSPRTSPHRVRYDDVVLDAITATVRQA